MTDSVLDRLTRNGKLSPDSSLDTALPDPPDDTDDYMSFGWLRGIRDRATMLELRKRDGQIRALSYAWLQLAEFDPSRGITLTFPKATITLIGQHLNTETRPHIKLFQGITRQRVTFIQEADEVMLMQAGEGETVVERIEW